MSTAHACATGHDGMPELRFQRYHEEKAQSLNDGVTDIAALISGKAQPRSGAGGFALHRIGDAVSCRSIHAAMLGACQLCRRL